MKTYLKLFALLLVLISCKKDEIDIELDKQINFKLSLLTGSNLGNIAQVWGDTAWSDPYFRYSSCLKNFNKSNYMDVKSAVISVPMFSYHENIFCIVDLYNLTDSISIENSQIETNSLSTIYITSPNLIDDLPDKTIDLALRIKASELLELHSSTVGVGMNSYLILNR